MSAETSSESTNNDLLESEPSIMEEQDFKPLAMEAGSPITLKKSSIEQIYAYIMKHGNSEMKNLAEDLPSSHVPWGYSPFSPVPSRFASVFPSSRKVKRFYDHMTKERLLAIASVYFFFERYRLFKREKTTLIGLYDAIKLFFETTDHSVLSSMLWKPKGNYIVTMDLSIYHGIWKSSE